MKDSEGTYEANQERRSENTPGESLNEVQASVKAGRPFSIPPHIKDIDIEGLTPDQKDMVFKLLTEEQDPFARDGNDIGCIKKLQLELHLVDHTPVQKNYVAVPKPLYSEMKAYIKDLLN